MGEKVLEFFTRTDGKWAWRLIASNGQDIVATDGGQGYENRDDCVAGAESALDFTTRGIRVTF